MWMQVGSDEGETKLVSVESTDRFDSSTLGFDRSDEDFRSIEASLHQVLHRTTANEPLRIVQQIKGQIRSAARDRREIRSEEHVWQQ